MNNRVREYLIKVARQPGKFVFYSDVVKDCELGFNLATEYGQRQLSQTLGEVSAYESKHGRPLISALAIYKDERRNDHGDGFYKIAEELGKGKFKQLKENLFGFSEAEECRRYWQNPEHYPEYANVENGTQKNNTNMDFFTREELDFFIDWHMKPYDSDNAEHVEAKEYLMETVWQKSIYLCEKVISEVEGFRMEGKKYWSQRGWKEVNGRNVQAAIFKPYTWVKVFRNTDRGKDIYFTFGVDAGEEAFIYKLDCRNNRDSKLTAEQIELCRSLTPASARWNELSFEDLLNSDWNSLTSLCVDFINSHTEHYDAIIDAVWGSPISPAIFKNTLIRRNKPTAGKSEFPEHSGSFAGVDVDFIGKAKEQKDLGDKGEALVKEHEINCLKDKGMDKEAALVDIVKDGVGYDVLSFDDEGNEKYIEVKTTTGNEYAAFHLSDNEHEFMKRNAGCYSIYRVYNYDEDNNFGEFFEVSGQVEEQLLMKPIQYKVMLKGDAIALS